jgi:hypothetical protein
MRTSKAHQIAGWLRVEGRVYSATLDRILNDRDKQMLDNPNCSGLPPASREWFWSTQLPALVSDPKIRDQVLARAAELSAMQQAIDRQVQQQAGALLAQQAEIAAELALLEQVLP